MAEPKTITVIGAGYVGLTTAAIFAHCGFTVYAVEINPTRLKSIQDGKSFFYEVGVDPLLAEGIAGGTLIATDSYEDSLPVSDFVFSCVGTPDNPDGSSNLTYVFDAAAKAAGLMKPGALYIQKSTVPVGTGRKVLAAFKEQGKDIPYVSNPEFLREGTAISDTLWFDRIVAGSDNAAAAETVLDLYRTMADQRDKLGDIAGISTPADVPETYYIQTALSSAELIKVSANAFLSLKISFANSIAKLADQADADVTEVMAAVGADRRIGRAFLNAGRGYGGGCFPKDVSGLIRSAEDYGVGMEIMNAATEVNQSMPHYIINKAKAALGLSPRGNAFKGKRVAVLGLAFKAGTSDVRRSPAIAIANTLADQGAIVAAYDPEAMEEARESLLPGVQLCTSTDDAVKDATAIFIATDWPEFKTYDYRHTGAHLIVDGMNSLSPAQYAGLRYVGVGVGASQNQ